MSFYIKELDDGSAVLMTDNGYYLFKFHSIEAAIQACEDWYRRQKKQGTENYLYLHSQDPAAASCLV
ncbi:MAG: hypothetical protein ACE5EH_07560 [Gammaproteobacteria bacterium]